MKQAAVTIKHKLSKILIHLNGKQFSAYFGIKHLHRTNPRCELNGLGTTKLWEGHSVTHMYIVNKLKFYPYFIPKNPYFQNLSSPIQLSATLPFLPYHQHFLQNFTSVLVRHRNGWINKKTDFGVTYPSIQCQAQR